MPYLIDGHNLIPKLGLRLDAPDDEMELVAILQEFSRLSRREAEVYFDGAPSAQARTHKFGMVTAHFIRLGVTADSAIKARLQKMGRGARNWVVVSSDHEVQNAAKNAHAESISSDLFAGQLKHAQASAPQATGERILSAEEIDEWLKFFDKKE
ncbi:MAG: NYN domain-containing protein [Chloroflexi bacterium]|nr:NYN domain-containing protein [Chloroflexota bacterium]